MAEVGTAYVTLIPTTSGFSQLASRALAPGMASTGKGLGLKMGAALGIAGIGAAAVGIIKGSVSLEASFSKTMNEMAAVTDAPKAQMKSLSDLAIQLGADTIFSANESSEAMLELAKNGITPATIEAGALAAALELAAAGGIGIAEAAVVMGNTLNAFGLKGKDSAEVADALAGAANASSADIGSLSQGLSQVSASAADSGQTVQETTAALAAFANAGIAGSDAGTSLKTMLARLVPSTDKAQNAFLQYGLAAYSGERALKGLAEKGIKPLSGKYEDVYAAVGDYVERTGQAERGTAAFEGKVEDLLWSTGSMGNAFVKANGEFKGIGAIAGVLEDRFSKLSGSERSAALQTLFGSDSRRAATVLMNEGEKGLAKYIKATSKTGNAQKIADAKMKGTAGALERLSGSVETVRLQFGLWLQPVVVKVLDTINDAVNDIMPGVKGLADSLSGGGGMSEFGAALADTGAVVADFARDLLPTLIDVGQRMIDEVGPALDSIGGLINDQLLPAFENVLPVVKPVAKFLIEIIGGAVIGAFKGAVQVIEGVIQVVSGVFNLVAALVQGDWKGAWKAVKQIVSGIIDAVIGAIKVWFNIGILGIFKQGAKLLLKNWKALWNLVKGILPKAFKAVSGLVFRGLSAVGRLFVKGIKGFLGFWKGLFVGLKNLVVTGWKVLRSAFGGALAAIKTVITTAVSKYIGFWKGLFTKLKDAAVAGFRKLVDLFKGLPKKIVSAVGDLKSVLVAKGKSLIEGLWAGISSMGKWLADKITGFVADKIPGPIAKALGISSPSKVMAEQARWIPLGMVQGIESQGPRVEAAMRRLTTGASVTRPRLDLVGAGASGRAGGPMFGDVHVQAHDYHDFVAQTQRRARHAAGGGVAL